MIDGGIYDGPSGKLHGSGREPYRSRDTSHVPAPDPDHFWTFSSGQERVIGIKPYLAFRVEAIFDTWIEGLETLGEQKVRGELHLDHPVVITRSASGEPQVTLTLRRITEGFAFLQVTVNPKLGQAPRQ